MLLPLCVYLASGAVFLLAGFVSLFRIRTVMKSDGNRTDKLEHLMMRIGFFSALFVLPAVGLLGCLFYEYFNHGAWMVQWNRDMCRVFSIPCPNRQPGEPEARPLMHVFMLKYVCSMLVGVTSSVWLYSGKTVVSWRSFIGRMQGMGGGSECDRVAAAAVSATAEVHRPAAVMQQPAAAMESPGSSKKKAHVTAYV